MNQKLFLRLAIISLIILNFNTTLANPNDRFDNRPQLPDANPVIVGGTNPTVIPNAGTNTQAENQRTNTPPITGQTAPQTNTTTPSTTAGTVTYESYTNFPGVGRISNLCQLILGLWYLGFAVLLTSVLGMFLWGGYIYVTAGINAGKVNQAKEIFTNTITGLIIGLSIFIIINIINPGLLQGNCSIPSVGSGSTLGEDSGIPSAGTPCDSNNPNIKCIKPGEVSRVDITSCFYRNSNGAFHGGTDWVVSGAGNPVAILTAGQVIDVCRGNCGGFGNSVVIKGPSQGGYDLYNYSHMASIASGIEKGMNLGKGTIVGIQGSTGSSTGAHVDTKISNCVLCKRSGSHFTKPTKVLMQYIKETYGVDPVCGCRNSCNDT